MRHSHHFLVACSVFNGKLPGDIVEVALLCPSFYPFSGFPLFQCRSFSSSSSSVKRAMAKAAIALCFICFSKNCVMFVAIKQIFFVLTNFDVHVPCRMLLRCKL